MRTWLGFFQPPIHSNSDLHVYFRLCESLFLSLFKWTFYCHTMAFAKGIRDFQRFIALAASNKLQRNAMNALSTASCNYNAIPPIETEKKSSVKKTDIQRRSFSNNDYTWTKITTVHKSKWTIIAEIISTKELIIENKCERLASTMRRAQPIALFVLSPCTLSVVFLSSTHKLH